MTKPFTIQPHLRPALLAAFLAIASTQLNAGENIRLSFPDQDPGGPVYARIERPFLIHNGSVAAIVFYREPVCVPEDFNLLDNVDLVGFPTNARAFRCPLTVGGFKIWTSYPFPGPPNLVFTNGSGAVPMWFVSWTELQAALADDRLTIDELRLLPSLQEGYATHFQETLQLTPSAQTSSINLLASGVMVDGRFFVVNYVFRDGVVKSIEIKIK